MENGLCIRADGNSSIGLGHIMRCLSIADAFRCFGETVIFLTADENPATLIRSRGYQVLVLDSDYRAMEEELPVLEEIIKDRQIPFLLIDSYYAGAFYLDAVSAMTRIGCLDDYGRERLSVEVLLNYNIYADRLPYGQLYQDAAVPVKLLLGSRYAPLRPEFAHTGYEIRDHAAQVLVTTGGADAYHAAAQFVKAMLPCVGTDTVFHVISGPFHTSRAALLDMGRKCPNVVVHENVVQMAELMAACDIAVSAAGSTLYELCAIGVPTVYFSFVENQELPARYFAEDTKMLYAGNFAQGAEAVLNNMVESTKRLLASLEERTEISNSMKAVTDGHGAERVAECLKAYLEEITA